MSELETCDKTFIDWFMKRPTNKCRPLAMFFVNCRHLSYYVSTVVLPNKCF